MAVHSGHVHACYVGILQEPLEYKPDWANLTRGRILPVTYDHVPDITLSSLLLSHSLCRTS